MVEYIDKNGAIKILEKYRLELSSTYSAGLTTAKNAIKGIPTEDVVPRAEVKKAKQEVAREIFEEIMNIVLNDPLNYIKHHYEKLTELKKKYIGE